MKELPLPLTMRMLVFSLQPLGGPERRVWRAGQASLPGRRPTSAASAASTPQEQQQLPGNAAAASGKEPLPMTESACRIAMALDSMIAVRPSEPNEAISSP